MQGLPHPMKGMVKSNKRKLSGQVMVGQRISRGDITASSWDLLLANFALRNLHANPCIPKGTDRVTCHITTCWLTANYMFIDGPLGT